MFARFLEMTVRPEKKSELVKKLKEEVFPLFQKYKGFADVVHLEVESEPTKVFSISFWRDKTDAEKYEKENFARVKAIYEPFLTMPIVVRPCRVDETIPRKKIAVAA